MSDRRKTALFYFDQNRDFMDTVVPANIEHYRKGRANLKIKDKTGKAVKNAKIKVTQKNHEFKYGANIFMLDELETAEKNALYKEHFKDLLNLATVPFYWSDLEPEPGKPRYTVDSPKIYRRPATDLCVDFCLENGIEPKCHCLNYDNFIPEWLKDADVTTHKKMLEKRFSELSERYADKIPSWEVTNETYNDNSQNRTKFYKEDDFVEWSFRTAEKYFPTNHLIINECYLFENWYRENRSAYFMQLERLFRNGVSHLDSIGMQFHGFFTKDAEAYMAKTRYNPVYLYEVLDLYARFGKRLQITEMTIPAYSDSEEDELVQAELVENLYTVFFSHPAMEAIIYWNLVDGYAAWAPYGDMKCGENVFYGGLVNFDLSRKKSYDVVKKLFSEKWHTETSCVASENGDANFRGFYGDYELEIESDGKVYKKTISLSRYKNNITEITL